MPLGGEVAFPAIGVCLPGDAAQVADVLVDGRLVGEEPQAVGSPGAGRESLGGDEHLLHDVGVEVAVLEPVAPNLDLWRVAEDNVRLGELEPADDAWWFLARDLVSGDHAAVAVESAEGSGG